MAIRRSGLMKMCSSLTLFAEAGAGPMVAAAPERWFGGQRDAVILTLLGARLSSLLGGSKQ